MDREGVIKEVSRGVSEGLAKMAVGEIFANGEKAKQGAEDNKKKLRTVSGKATYAVMTNGPDYFVDLLWPEEEFAGTGVGIDRLRILDAVWWGLSDEARKDLGTAAVSKNLHEENVKSREALVEKSKEAVESIFSAGAIDLAPQETDELVFAGGQSYWESMIVLAVKMGVSDFSLHMPFLRNLNLLAKGKKGLFNLETMCISGFLPRGEIDRMKLKLSGSEEEKTLWLEGEKKRRAEETVNAAKAQIDWFRRMKGKYDLNKDRKTMVTVHLSSVGMHHRLEEEDLARGLVNLNLLQEYAGDDFSLLVETQGMEAEQLDRILAENPKLKIVFDIAHVKIEGGRYGDFWQALEKYKDRIGVIHFAQPVEEGGGIRDAHLSISSEGVFSDEDKKRVVRFVRDNGIWMTFESDFLKKDFDYLLSALE